MNQNNCDIARDLMPLSVDGVCSEGSQRFLDSHVAECKPCRDYFNGMKAGNLMNMQVEPAQEAQALKQGLRWLGKRFKALWITIAALACAFVLLVAAGINQIAWNWTTDVPLELYSTNIGSTSALVYITTSCQFLEQDFNGYHLDMQHASDAENHTGQPEAVILTYTLSYYPRRAKESAKQLPDYRYTASLADYELCRDGNNIYLIDGMEGVTAADGSHLLLLDTGLPVSEICIKEGDHAIVIYKWGDEFNIYPEQTNEDGVPRSRIMLRKDYEALQTAE